MLTGPYSHKPRNDVNNTPHYIIQTRHAALSTTKQIDIPISQVLFLDPDEVRFRAFGTKKYYYTKKAMPNFVQFQINSSSIIDISW